MIKPISTASSRKILPFGQTPSLKASDYTTPSIDKQITETKVYHRLMVEYVSATIESVFETILKRSKTTFQGSHASKGWQAGHGALAPATQDNFTENVIQKIEKEGITPTKSGPFLQNRIGLTEEEQKILHKYHKDENFVRALVISRLPIGGNVSSLAGTRFDWNRNATFDNPDESNKYDTHLEAKVSTLREQLQQQRREGKLNVETSMQKLVSWFLEFYTTSVKNLTEKLEFIKKIKECSQKMSTFEKTHQTAVTFNTEEFKEYIENAADFLNLTRTLLEEKIGSPLCKEFKTLRNEETLILFSQLVYLSKQPTTTGNFLWDQYLKAREFLSDPIDFDLLIKKYELYQEEATVQQETVQAFADPCIIPNLSKWVFGVMKEGKRQAPSPFELRKQVFELCAPATPLKRSFDKLTDPNDLPDPLSPLLAPIKETPASIKSFTGAPKVSKLTSPSKRRKIEEKPVEEKPASDLLPPKPVLKKKPDIRRRLF